MKRLILLFWFILLFLYSCQSKKGDGSFLPLTELQPLTLGMMPTLDGLPFHIAKTQGIYDSLGLNLTILSFNSANDRDAAFQARKMDGMITDYPSAVMLQAIHHADLGLVLKMMVISVSLSLKKVISINWNSSRKRILLCHATQLSNMLPTSY